MNKRLVCFLILLFVGCLGATLGYSYTYYDYTTPSNGIDSILQPLSSGCALIFPSRRDTRTSIFLFLWVGPLAIIIWKWIRHKTQRWY